MVRVRFAPSPTGNLHIGGARTALFNWLYAKSHGGKFILRIEDTDTLRSQKEYLDEILFSLNWLGLSWDEIYYQSQRFSIYQEYAEKLLSEGKAYKAEANGLASFSQSHKAEANGLASFSQSHKAEANGLASFSQSHKAEANGLASFSQSHKAEVNGLASFSQSHICSEISPKGEGQAIILKVLPGKVQIEDMIRGTIEFDTSVIKDQVLIKSDGSPTYNFACVVDDALMNITHVIRGDDHISNTPKQILLYQALGLVAPYFAHLPLILSKEGGRLSKRKGATAISEYREMGYLSKPLVNFLLLLGWSPGENREVIDINEAVKLFDIHHINKTAAVLDMDKLSWLNNQYLKNEDPEKLTDALIPELVEKALINKDDFDRTYVLSLVKLLQARLTVLNDFVERAEFFFRDDFFIDPQAQEKFLSRDFSKEFSLFIQRLDKLEKFDVLEIEKTFRQLVSELDLEAKVLIHPIRVALTGKTVGPGLFELIHCLGKVRAKERLARWIKK